jgi:hypothetical protein
MRLRSHGSRWFLALTLAAATASTAASSYEHEGGAQNKKPSISVKANPPVGFAPLRVVVTAELKGGTNDFEDFYCASVEWDWGDDTKSESKTDCDPYEPGKSEIKRRYVQDHTYRDMRPAGPEYPGASGPTQYRVKFSLKQKNKVVGSGQATVEIRSGLGSGHEE